MEYKQTTQKTRPKEQDATRNKTKDQGLVDGGSEDSDDPDPDPDPSLLPPNNGGLSSPPFESRTATETVSPSSSMSSPSFPLSFDASDPFLTDSSFPPIVTADESNFSSTAPTLLNIAPKLIPPEDRENGVVAPEGGGFAGRGGSVSWGVLRLEKVSMEEKEQVRKRAVEAKK